MAEVLAVVASGISVASLAIQILENLGKVTSFCESIREAPDEIQRILVELHILTDIVSAIQVVHEKYPLPEPGLSVDLEQKLSSGKRITRTWARIQTVLSEKKIAALRGHLERAKSALQLLQSCDMYTKLRSLDSLSTTAPKQLGYTWETNLPEDHVQIDDGLEKPFYLPIDLCSTIEDLQSILVLKYKSKQLPGLAQIQLGHITVLDWFGNGKTTNENWECLVKERRRVRLAFVMSTFYSFPLQKCMRCLKPRLHDNRQRRVEECSSCGLVLYKVESDAIPFQTVPVTIGRVAGEYRDYRLASRRKKLPAGNSKYTFAPEGNPAMTSSNVYDNPPIDFVCKRLVIKWEPLFNIVHRYLYCRCVIRLSTPSQRKVEQTILILDHCPRHTTSGIHRLDYGDIDYHKDQYFKRFGGYRSFQGLIYRFIPSIYELLGGESFLPEAEIDDALEALKKLRQGDGRRILRIHDDYCFEINEKLMKTGIKIPDMVAQAMEKEKLRKKNAVPVENEDRRDGRCAAVTIREEEGRKFCESPMVQEVKEILQGKWSGIPHWKLDD